MAHGPVTFEHEMCFFFPVVVLPIRRETSVGAPILDFKSKHFLCVDIEGKLFSSMMDSRRDCLFQHLQMENHVDLFYSSSNGLLLHLERAKIHVKRHDLLKRHLVYRKKRSQQVKAENPEAEPIMSDQDMQQDQERAGAVSKETITSCDDPLRVLHSNSPGSPIKTAVEKTAKE
ncbi:fibroblast growth factor 23 isoform X2 [Salmo trutta]|uniref:fibroblast growth factor 23 isoform X2 n=1 Tax=Salmo trutta TaxID=8032 RepID=UPI001130A195|nr:fibroblast growth factor 23-like isoform X2 [Salmo trutta]